MPQPLFDALTRLAMARGYELPAMILARVGAAPRPPRPWWMRD